MFGNVVRIAVLALVAGGLHAAPAAAQDVGPAEGALCGFASITDPTIENGEVQTGEIDGGPLAATAPGATISLSCTVQVGVANASHNGADSANASSAASLQVAAVPPTLVSYSSPPGQRVYVCTSATVNGVTHYYDGANGVWSTSSGVFCQEAFVGGLGPDECAAIGLLSPGVPGIVDVTPTGGVYVLGEEEPFGQCPPYLRAVAVWVWNRLKPP